MRKVVHVIVAADFKSFANPVFAEQLDSVVFFLHRR